MITHRNSFAALCLVFCCMCQSDALTLSEAIEKTLKNNLSLATAAWDSRIADEQVRLATAPKFPRIDAQAGYTVQLEPQAIVANGRATEMQEPDFGSAGISINYTIYDFGRRNGKKAQALASANATRSIVQARQQDVLLQAIEGYYAILEAQQLATISGEEVLLLLEHRRVAGVLFDEGVVTRNDVLQADVRLAAARQKRLSVENRITNSWLRLNNLMGMPHSFRETLEVLNEDPSPPVILELQEALASRPDLVAIRKNLDAASYEVREAQGGFYPELFTRLALDYVQNDKVREQTIMSATIGFKVNLFDGFATTSLRDKAVRTRSRTVSALRQAEEQARLEVAVASNDAQVALERIKVTKTATSQSEENLRINKERYRERVGTATEVLDAQTLLTQARTDYFRALYDYQTAVARLKHATGEL